MSVLDHSKLHQKYFEELSAIPRASFKEEKCADYLEQFAKDMGLDYVRDELHNVVIYKPASAGYEDHETVILQAHTDMVCEKNADCDHDFDTEPLDLYVEDGFLKARGTTLGADDGMGVAYMMALLSMDLPHPALECAFTVQEEVGLYGAFALKKEYFKGTRYVNLDFGADGKGTGITSAGGEMITLMKPVEFDPCELPAYRVFVTGLKGGHSGACIINELGNALKICARVMKEIAGCCDVQIIGLEGGMKNNAIPRECEAVFASSASEDVIRKAFDRIVAEIRNEIGYQEPGFEVIFEKAASAPAICEESSADLIDFMYVLPTGLRHRSLQIEGLPTASENLAVVHCKGDHVEIGYSLRAEKASLRDQMERELCILAAMYDATVSIHGKYPSWEYNPNSQMRAILEKIFMEQKGEVMETIATHGGLECGIFCDMIPGLDVVTMGASCSGAHTPQEQMNLESFDKMFEVLAAFLREL